MTCIFKVSKFLIGILFIAEYNLLKQCHSVAEEVEEEVFEVVVAVVAFEVAEEVAETEEASECYV